MLTWSWSPALLPLLPLLLLVLGSCTSTTLTKGVALNAKLEEGVVRRAAGRSVVPLVEEHGGVEGGINLLPKKEGKKTQLLINISAVSAHVFFCCFYSEREREVEAKGQTSKGQETDELECVNLQD